MDKATAKNRKIPFHILIACLLLLTVMTSGVTFAKFTSSGDASDAARVASYVFEVVEPDGDGADALLSVDMRKPGDVVEYEITLNNYTELGKVCEVAQSYTVQVSLVGSLPVTCKLLDSEGNTLALSTTDGEGATVSLPDNTVSSKNNTGVYSDGAPLIAGEQDSKTYTLHVEWPANENLLKYAYGGIVEIEVLVTSSQID